MAWGILILFVVLVLMAVPLAVALGLVSVLPSLLDSSFTASATYVIRSMVGGIDSFPLLAVPLFVLSGVLMAKGGISEKLFDVFSYFMGGMKGGIPSAVVLTCLFYGAVSGSGPATVASVGVMAIPVLDSLGYRKDFSAALLAVSGGLGVIIPPSIPFIMYGTSVGVSISDLFIAGVLPGILVATLLVLYVRLTCEKTGEDRARIEEKLKSLRDKGFKKLLGESIWALLCPVIILGSIYTGVASPTEAAVISVFYALVVGLFIYRTIKIENLFSLLLEAVRTYAPILFVLTASFAFSRVLTLLQVPQTVSAWVLGHFASKVGILLLMNLLLLAVGMLMDTTPAILILSPILLPIASAVGVDPVHFGVVMVLNLSVGFITPPIGVNLFVSSSLTGLPYTDIVRRVAPVSPVFILAILLVSFVPAISLALL